MAIVYDSMRLNGCPTLSDLLKKWLSQEWKEPCHQDFRELKSKLPSPPVLKFVEFDKPFELHTWRVILPLAVSQPLLASLTNLAHFQFKQGSRALTLRISPCEWLAPHTMDLIVRKRGTNPPTLLLGQFKFKQSQVYVSQGKLRLLILKEEYDSPIAGHRGERKNHHRMVSRTYHWWCIKDNIAHFVKA